jgi:hypothetical protein
MNVFKFSALAGGALLALILLTSRIPNPPTSQPCSNAWFNYLESQYFSTERENSFGDRIGLDYVAGNGSGWLDYIEAKAGMLHPPGGTHKDARCYLIQNHLASRTYVINDLTGWAFSFARR